MFAEQHRRAQTLQQELAQQKVDCQAQLQEQTDRYRLLFETIAQGVISYAADGVMIDANPAAQHILRLSLEQLQERSSSSLCSGVVYASQLTVA